MEGMEGVFGIMLPIIITLGAFVMVVYIRKFENLERMAIIDKGLSPDLFKTDKKVSTSPVLRWALLLIGAGVGLMLGYFFDEIFRMGEVAYFSCLLIFGGLGLLLAYVIEERKLKGRD
jgi:hypothetical protein